MSRSWFLGVLLLVILAVPRPAAALITGGEGNSPVSDPGWSKGAAPVFNVKARVAWWEGPPFGGGQYTAECRGDAAAFNAVLADFAKIEASGRRMIVHDGVGASFWLNPNGEEGKKKYAQIDWTFTVWIPAHFERLRGVRGELSDEASSYPTIHLYAGGNVKWDEVKVPDGITVDDQRLEAHGFTLADGTVLQGNVTDLATGASLNGEVALQRITPRKTGGYDYETTQIVKAVDGQWVLKSVPEGWYQVVVSAPGYVDRIAHHLTVKPVPLWVGVSAELVVPARLEGFVTGPDGKPLEEVSVRLDDVIVSTGQRYQTPGESEVKTDSTGKFVFARTPLGKTRVWCYKEGYCRPGLGLEVASPASELKLEMVKSSKIEVVVKFGDKKRPEGYIVEIEPEGGSVVGSWGGSGNIDKANQITFENVPPGRYVLKGRPNPGGANEETEPHTVDLKGGETEPVLLQAR